MISAFTLEEYLFVMRPTSERITGDGELTFLMFLLAIAAIDLTLGEISTPNSGPNSSANEYSIAL